ncbi:MAG: nucleotide exchange factor GrpE [Chloroflexota bacterium]|nr:nucleotide exchange factor GrpE [Chloroflexota bacterium]MDE3192868.1 nucleotide exchange factor GrpE [Chloroflexota bacterium]
MDDPIDAQATDLQNKVDELTRDLQRVAADFANYRRRNEAERSDFARFAKSELIEKLLEVLDGFDRALETVPSDYRDAPWVEGIWLVERKLRDILAAEGLEAVGSVGKPFDPYVHEAIAHVDSSEPEGTVVDEVRKAYKLHDRILRPALVTVAKGPRGSTDSNDNNDTRARGKGNNGHA